MSAKEAVLQTFFLIFIDFYIFSGFFVHKIPFYVNLQTKKQKTKDFVSVGNHQWS